MTLTEETRKRLSALGISPKKRFGQNFMIDRPSLSAVAESLDIRKGETVLEIGPGLGFLTEELLKRGAKVQAVEKDFKLAFFLRDHFAGQNFNVTEKDILKTDLMRDLKIQKPAKVAGNIPYNITSPLLEWLIGQRFLVSSACLTVQWEVAQRLTASPGNRAWGALSIFLQFYSDVELARKIGRHHFYPPPRVDSAIVKITFLNSPHFPVKNDDNFFRIVRRSFQKRRKTLLNALADEKSEIFSKKNLVQCLSAAGIDPGRRPETLSLAEWARLSDMI